MKLEYMLQQLADHGYLVIENFLSEQQLEALRLVRTFSAQNSYI